MADTKKSPEKKRYYIVNPAGAVHEVTREHAKMRLRTVGYRMATSAEIAAYKKAPAHRGLGPVAEAWSPEPVPEPEVE